LGHRYGPIFLSGFLISGGITLAAPITFSGTVTVDSGALAFGTTSNTTSLTAPAAFTVGQGWTYTITIPDGPDLDWSSSGEFGGGSGSLTILGGTVNDGVYSLVGYQVQSLPVSCDGF
jgi:hypothetical protein